jgi:hypothetical protein
MRTTKTIPINDSQVRICRFYLAMRKLVRRLMVIQLKPVDGISVICEALVKRVCVDS